MPSRRCARVKAIHWIGTKLWDPPMYYGTKSLEYFVDTMEYIVAVEKRVPTLDVALRATPVGYT